MLMIHQHELCERAFRFACDVAGLCGRLQERGPIVRRLSMKLLDAGTSIGANMEEGRAGQSKPDHPAVAFSEISASLRCRPAQSLFLLPFSFFLIKTPS